MPVKDREALERANSDANTVVEILMGEFGLYARSTENLSPLLNKQLGDVVTDLGCIEIQVSDKYENFSLTKDKMTQFLGEYNLPRIFLFGALRPNGKIFCMIPFDVVEQIVQRFQDNGTYYVIPPSTLRHPRAIWGTSIEGVIRMKARRFLEP